MTLWEAGHKRGRIHSVQLDSHDYICSQGQDSWKFLYKNYKGKKKTVYYWPKHGKRNNTYFPEECIANLLQESTGLIRIE